MQRPCFYLLSALVWICTAQAAYAQTVDEVVQSLRKRGEQTKSLHIEWKGKAFDHLNREPGRVRPEDVNFESAGMWASDAGRYRYALRGIEWSESREKADKKNVILVYKDGRTRELFTSDARAEPIFRERERTLDKAGLNHQLLSAIRLAYWPLDPNLGLLQGEMGDVADAMLEKKAIDGKEHLVLRIKDTEIWVDPARAMLPVRCDRYRKGHLMTAVNAKYVEQDKEWQLASWSIVYSVGPGIINRDYAETVTSLRRNEKLDDGLFNLEKPPVP